MLQATACAKLNLFLHITGTRPDGYHLLESLVTFANIGDRVRVEAADWLTLEAYGPYASTLPKAAEENLVMRTARRLQQHAGTRRGAKITLEKNLPVSSGMGGGSSDAARTARLLSELWKLAYSPGDLAALLFPLGADIPVCLHGKPALVSGIGEIIEDISLLPAFHLVLANPGASLATTAVFAKSAGLAAGRPGRSRAVQRDMPGQNLSSFISLLKETANDLELPAIVLMPEIRTVLDGLWAQGGCLLARMSGSGATCFGIFESLKAAEKAADNLKATHPAYWVRVA